MVVVSYSGREINAKIVYYGPGLSGKTTNLEKIYDSVPETNRGRMVSMKTQTDRTLFFDLLPLDLGDLQGMKTRLLLYTVPGQVYYNATRKLVLKGVDAVVFVADSAPDKMAENRESLANLEMNLKAYGIDIRTLPLVMQFNKRDLPNAVPVEELNRELNRLKVPWFEAQAANGVGIFETLRGISKLLLAKISKDVLEKDRGAVSGMKRAGAAAAAREEEAGRRPTGAGGKLLKYLKRAKGGESADQAPDVAQPSALEPSPLLSDDVLIDESSASLEAVPRTLNAEEELVLTEEDMIARPGPGAVRLGSGITSGGADDEAFEFEREPGVLSSSASAHSARLSADSETGGVRRISVPIDLGLLPRSGRVTLTFEISVRVDSDEPKKGSGSPKSSEFDQSFPDLESIP